MQFQRSYFNKAIAVTMLVVLLLVHSIKLLHGHGYFQTSCKSNIADVISASHAGSADCGICSYQIGKDADDFVFAPSTTSIPVYDNSNDARASSYIYSFFTFFDSRGPPSCL
jgi:hypothetical protein